MSVLLTLCVVLLALATPGRGTPPWEPCTGKGASRWAEGAAARGQLEAWVCLGGPSGWPGRGDGQRGPGRDERAGGGLAVEMPTGWGPASKREPAAI